MFRSCLLSRYAVIYERDNPSPLSMFFSNISANADHPCNFTSYSHPTRLSRRPTEWIHATYMSYETCAFSLPLMYKLELRVSNLHVGMSSCNVRHGNTENFHANSGFPFWFSFANIRISSCVSAISFTCAYEKHQRRETKGEHSHNHQCPSHQRHEATLIGVLAVLKTAVYVTNFPSTLLILSIHSASGGRAGNTILITVNTG